MSLKEVQPGTYTARAMEGVWCKIGKNSTPAVGVKFEFNRGDGQMENIWHTMYLTEKLLQDGKMVLEKTMDTLCGILGYIDGKPLMKKAEGEFFDKSFLADKEVSIVLENETYEGKTYLRVKWVNELGGNQMIGVPVEQVLGNRKLSELAAAARMRMGYKAPAPAPMTSDMPF